MRKFPFTFSILQYEHNPWLKERLNVGVLLFSAEGQFLKIKKRGSRGRISKAYAHVDASSFAEDLSRIETAVSRFARQDVAQSNLFSGSMISDLMQGKGNPAQRLAQKIASDADSSYRWVEGGVGLCADLDEKLEQLFNRFVAVYDDEKGDLARSDNQVWQQFSPLLTQRGLSQHIVAEPSFSTALGTIKCQASYVNGSLNVLQPLSFDLTTDSGIMEKTARWGAYAEAIRRAEGENTKTHFVVGAPRSNELQRNFHNAVAYLSEKAGDGIVVPEADSSRLVDLIASQMAGHC